MGSQRLLQFLYLIKNIEFTTTRQNDPTKHFIDIEVFEKYYSPVIIYVVIQ